MKKKSKKLKPVARFVGPPSEIYIPSFKQKLVKKGELVVEMSIEEAKKRRDFTITYIKED